MEIGAHLPVYGAAATREGITLVARRVEALGFDSLWVSDHVVIPWEIRSRYPYNATGDFPLSPGTDFLEPLTALTLAAAVTSRVRLGTSVLVLPHRHPVLTAKMLATLDHLAPGRVILGAGVGWLREEFEALGAPPFEERGPVTDEYLRFMRATWTTDPVSFSGRYVSVSNVHALPKPVQAGGIPVWIGGHTDAAVRRAARLGDGWHPIALRPPGLLFPDAYAKRAQQIETWAREAGRDPRAITLSVRVPMEVRPKRLKPPAGERPLFQGTAEQVIADIRAYAKAGVTHFVWDFTNQDLRLVVENLERFAHDVRPKLRGRPTAAAAGARSAKSAGGRAAAARGSARVVGPRSSGGASGRRQAARPAGRRRKGGR
jgi:probable F420-dependent oxidoreductase